jgi:RNA polymerase sigma-70 factor (ECF subfamily)
LSRFFWNRHCEIAITMQQPSQNPKLRLVAATGKERGTPVDREIVRACLAGEPGAAEALWYKHSRMVFRLLGRVLGPGGEVDDVAQDVFATVFSKLGSVRDPDALQSFVYSVAVRVAKWELRKRRMRRVLQLWGDVELPEIGVVGVDAEARQALMRLYRILDRMGSEERLIFALRHIEGKKLQEIASSLGVSLATVKRKLQRAGAWVSAEVERDPLLAGYRTIEEMP